MEKEIWLPVLGYEGFYEVSNFGNIRSTDRVVIVGNYSKPLKGKEIKQSVNWKGYCIVHLYKDSKREHCSVHRLVLIAFNGKSGKQVNHINGVKNDNRLENLEYVTNYENLSHYLQSQNSSSKYRGVSFAKRHKKWIASIYHSGKSRYLGAFLTEERAHQCRLNYELSIAV